jgi:hypothetical protein
VSEVLKYAREEVYRKTVTESIDTRTMKNTLSVLEILLMHQKNM